MRLSIAAGLAVLLLAAPAAADKHHFEFMKKETVGPLRLDMTEAQIAQALAGKPARGREQKWEADGLYHQKWSYGAQGLKLGMAAEKKGGAKTLASIECAARCTLKTSRGIGIGSTLEDVQKAYAAEFNKEDSKLPGAFVAGSIYGGLMISFKGGKVDGMFLGPAAE